MLTLGLAHPSRALPWPRLPPCSLPGYLCGPQADLDAGSFTNTATADSDQTAPVDDSETVTFTQAPAMTVLKSVTSTGPYALGRDHLLLDRRYQHR